MEEDGVDDGEDGGVGADAEGERKNGDEREARAFFQHANAAAQILAKSSGHLGASRAHLPARLFDGGGGALFLEGSEF